MSAEAAVLTRSWSVGRHTVTLTAQRPKLGATTAATIEWDAGVPDRLTADELAQYRRGRNRAVLELARVLGVRIAMVEL